MIDKFSKTKPNRFKNLSYVLPHLGIPLIALVYDLPGVG
jgi:hypothetical protein